METCLDRRHGGVQLTMIVEHRARRAHCSTVSHCSRSLMSVDAVDQVVLRQRPRLPEGVRRR